ncbi:MAG: UDP-2,3-diacylglucosamine diphosphatase LpxI [Pseudomonadota bacterium]
MSGPLAIIAGGGALPWDAARAIGPRREVLVIAIEGEADAAPAGIPAHRFTFGQIGSARKLAHAHGCTEILMLGHITKRPDFKALAPDRETLRLLPRIIKAVVGGDDSIVRRVAALVEAEGFRVVSVAEAVPELLAPKGAVGKHGPDAGQAADIAVGTQFLDAAAPFDVGQAVVVVEGRIIAVEGAEGTDQMLERVTALRAARRFSGKPGRGVLVKRAKVGQDMRSDVPVVGRQTLELTLAAQLGGIAVEAGRTILAQRGEMAALADAKGAFVTAL